MVATTSFVTNANAGGMADYYMKPTQPEWERNQDLDYQMRHVPDYDGTVPVFRQNMPSVAVEGFRLDMPALQTDPRPQLANLFAGLRADGSPSGKRSMAAYVRQDGKDFKPKAFFDITITTDISVGIALANTETPAARALILSAALEANEHAVTGLQQRLGFTRQGAGGRGGYVPAHTMTVAFPHFTSRPTQTGFVAPNLHFHNIIFSPVVTDSGRIGALDMMKFRNSTIIEAKFNFHDKFAELVNRLGIQTHFHKIGTAIISDVPNHVKSFFGQRGNEIEVRARENAETKGLEFEKLPKTAQARFRHYAAMQTRGDAYDGVADTPAWRLHCVRLNYGARDLPRLAIRAFNIALESNLTPAQRLKHEVAQRLKHEVRQTWQQTRQAAEQAKLRQQPLAFSVKARRQVVAATLALQLTMAKLQPALSPAEQLKQQFTDLHNIATTNKIVMQNRLAGRKLVHSLTPLLVELRRMSETIQSSQKQSIQTQPMQKDHESLGAYMAQKHRVPAEFGPQIAAAGELVQQGRMSLTDASTAIMRHRDHLQERLTSAVADTAGFYDATSVKQSSTIIGTYEPNKPVIFANSYADAALARDATQNKLAVVVGYSSAGTDAIMQKWQDAAPKQDFIRMSDASGPATAQPANTALAMPPPNAANVTDWQTYAKTYGTDAVGSNIRQAYRQEFRQGLQQKQTLAAE